MDDFIIVEYMDKDKWSEFISNHPRGNPFQTPEMMDVYNRTKRYDPIFLSVVDDRGNIKAMLLASLIKEFRGFIGSFSARSIIQGGPLFVENGNGLSAVKILMEHYDKIACKKVLYTEIRNLWDTQNISNLLSDVGYEYIEIVNFLIDLTKSSEELWAGLTKERRWAIRKAQKSGVTVKEAEGKEDILEFYNLLREHYRQIRVPLADKSLFDSVFELLRPKGMSRIHLARYNGQTIGGSLILAYKGQLYLWYQTSSKQYLRLHPNELLNWHAIRWGSENGYRIFDFLGAGNPNVPYGVRDYKRQFGGYLVSFGRYKRIYSSKKLWLSNKGFEVWRRLKR